MTREGDGEDLSRLSHPKMAYYRHVYRNIPRYSGSDLSGKRVSVYCEQGMGDTIQFARYIPDLMARGCQVTVHAHSPLHRLFRASGIGHELWDRDDPDIPDHDFHIPSLSLPFLGFSESPHPYLSVPDQEVVEDHFNVGIAWEGNQSHSNNLLRSCRLSLFQAIHDQDDARLFMLQQKVVIPDLCDVGPDFALYGNAPQDLYDVARLIKSMDLVVSVDTAVLHLAGALGARNIFGLLSTPCDERWNAREWYPQAHLLRDRRGDWSRVFEMVNSYVKGRPASLRRRRRRPREQRGIIITGGIGDFLSLDSHITEEDRAQVQKVYLATRANSIIRQLVENTYDNPEVIPLIADYSRPFYSKSEVSLHLRRIGCPFPWDWEGVEDWSILTRFGSLGAFAGSPLMRLPLDHPFDLPEEFVVVFPSTDTESGTGRDFDQADWRATLANLARRQQVGVVLGGMAVGCPDHPRIVDLSGKTSILETMGILHQARGYVGIDSFLAILACQMFRAEDLAIKSINPHYLQNRAIYCAPYNKFKFVKDRISRYRPRSVRTSAGGSAS